MRSNNRHKIRFQDFFILSSINEWPTVKKYQQKELNLMCITCKKTTNFVFLCGVTNGEKIEYAKISYFDFETE